ncbi:MAG: hypothetical protein EZS28_019333 [Streblomastix strix]|uniref:Reverse transcriptase domain-containing protein n=1 Tax=Streblomastix strix TaxID=222440 RepID=A0A5J4VRF5_9EUKA|nr:MAG: hypothetical protein EZS28_019333 [Streblomastix strix]
MEEYQCGLGDKERYLRSPDGSFRKILDYSKLDKELKVKHFKMESVENLMEIIEQKDWIALIEIKIDFHLIKIEEKLSDHLAFQFNSKTYKYVAMPFCISLTPMIFAIILRPIIQEIWNNWKLKMVVYADDMILVDQDQQNLGQKILGIIQYLDKMGLAISGKKCRIVTTDASLDGWGGTVQIDRTSIKIRTGGT